MSKPLLSICIPVAPNRTQRVKAILSRLSLNKYTTPDVPFEVIIVDGGATDNLKEICLTARAHLDMKYVYLPLYEFVNPAYPRNVGFRIAEGEIFTMLDADYWVGENFVKGATAPFRDGAREVINNGYVLDTSENQRGGVVTAEQINEALLDPANLKKNILSLYDVCQIPVPCPPRYIWLWSAPRASFVAINGYDEQYCKGWGREDDDMFYRFMATGLTRCKDHYDHFCCLHLWHEQRRGVATNHEYYKRVSDPLTEPVRNAGRPWGRMITGGYSDIQGRVRDVWQHEAWIAEHLPDLETYEDDPCWDSLEEIRT